MEMILLAAACYTICGLSDKYAVSTAKLTGLQIPFLMAAATAVFMGIMLPFLDIPFFGFSWQLAVAVILIALNKLLEFVLSAKVLTEMSAFELKAWVGTVVFISYFADFFMDGKPISVVGLLFIAIMAVGLFLIAKSNKQQIHYKKIVLPLIFYIIVRFGYGLTIRYAEPYGSGSQILFFALILLAIALIPFVSLVKMVREKPKGVLVVSLTKLPNAVGLFAENAAVAVSLTGSAMIMPIVLVALFLIGVFRKEYCTKLNFIGAIISIVGIIGFQLLK